MPLQLVAAEHGEIVAFVVVRAVGSVDVLGPDFGGHVGFDLA